MDGARLVLLSTSPRVAPGLLSLAAWSVLRESRVLCADPGHPLLPYLKEAGVAVEMIGAEQDDVLVHRLLDLTVASATDTVFLLDTGDTFARRLATAMLDGTTAGRPVVEVLPGSYDLPGARLLDLVATMDRLRSPGGCPWDAQQTHESLATYLVEETYETLDAIETGDREHLREELGDLLLQVVFHSRIASEDIDQAWSVDDVAQDIVDKLVRRHPHVFAAGDAATAEEVAANWETLKAAEKGRQSATDGVPMTLPALALAAKLMDRVDKNGVQVPPDDGDGSVGDRLFALVGEARAVGLDPEAELRRRVRRFVSQVRAAEAQPS